MGAKRLSTIPPGQLDPTRDIAPPQLFSSFHTPLPEQYIWTSEDSFVGHSGVINYTRPGLDEQTEPHFFRASFNLDRVPAAGHALHRRPAFGIGVRERNPRG